MGAQEAQTVDDKSHDVISLENAWNQAVTKHGESDLKGSLTATFVSPLDKRVEAQDAETRIITHYEVHEERLSDQHWLLPAVETHRQRACD